MNFITFSVIYKNRGCFLCNMHIRSQRLTHTGHAYSVYRVTGHAYSVYRVTAKTETDGQQDCPLHRLELKAHAHRCPLTHCSPLV